MTGSAVNITALKVREKALDVASGAASDDGRSFRYRK